MPPSTSSKKPQGSHTRARSIVPAIPLPYIQKRLARDLARQNANKAASTTTVAEISNSGLALASPNSPTEQTSIVNKNDQVEPKGTESNRKLADIPLPTMAQVKAILVQTTGNIVPVPTEQVFDTTKNHQPEQTKIELNSDVVPSTKPVKTQDKIVLVEIAGDSVPAQKQSKPTADRPASEANGSTNDAFKHTSHVGSEDEILTTTAPQAPLAAPPGAWTLPILPQNMHSAHLSQSSIAFGSLNNSHHSTPAPPVSANGGPQYKFPPPTQILQPYGDGYSISPPPGLGFLPPMNNHIMGSPDMNTLARNIQELSFRPTPSGTPGLEHAGQYNGTPAGYAIQNHLSPLRERGVNGQNLYPGVPAGTMSYPRNRAESNTLYEHSSFNFPAAPFTPTVTRHNVPPEVADLLEYMKIHFGNSTLADYDVEVRFPQRDSDQIYWLRVPGHALILARSPVLKQMMFEQAFSAQDAAQSRVILIETTDRFARTDAFWDALQFLYQPDALLTDRTEPNPTTPVRSKHGMGSDIEVEKFELALGYAAAGHILQIIPVIRRGIHVASKRIGWRTVEKALDFGLDGGISPHWAADIFYEGVGPSTYGPDVDLLVGMSLDFLLSCFPPNFILDRDAPDAEFPGRYLPMLSAKRGHNSSLSGVKFGEFSADEFGSEDEKFEPSAVLSRVLLSLPFPLLKYLFDSPNFIRKMKGSGVLREVVREREERRTRCVADARIPYDARLRNAHAWQSAGWMEVLRFEEEKKPVFQREWVDFK